MDDIVTKIENKTVTVDDFNQLIAEAVVASTNDRVRRRTRRTPTDSHIDANGHQHLKLPTFQARVAPKRAPAGDNQMRHRGKTAHRRSSRTQSRTKAGKTPKQFLEAIQYLKQYYRKPMQECQIGLESISNISNLHKLLTKLLTDNNYDRDWVYNIKSLCENTNVSAVREVANMKQFLLGNRFEEEEENPNYTRLSLQGKRTAYGVAVFNDATWMISIAKRKPNGDWNTSNHSKGRGLANLASTINYLIKLT